MTTIKITALLATCLLTLSFLYALWSWVMRKNRLNLEIEGRFKNSYAIWILGILISFALSTHNTMLLVNEAVDTLSNFPGDHLNRDIFTRTMLFTGFNVLWLSACYILSILILSGLFGKRSLWKEMENDHQAYFIIHALLFATLIYCMLPLEEMIMRYYMPSIINPVIN